MQASVHLSETDTHRAVEAECFDSYVALKVKESVGSATAVVFVSTVEQAQQLVEAAVEIRTFLRAQRDAANIADLTVEPETFVVTHDPLGIFGTPVVDPDIRHKQRLGE